MGGPPKYCDGRIPFEGTAQGGGVLSESILHAAGRRESSERGSSVRHEKQSAIRAGGKNFGLTPREKQVMVFVVAGYTKKDIAKELGVSAQTIKHDVANIFNRLAVSNRLQLLLFVLHHRLIDDVQEFPPLTEHLKD
jgi:DNA-binding NarL/FixJ family response regulator